MELFKTYIEDVWHNTDRPKEILATLTKIKRLLVEESIG